MERAAYIVFSGEASASGQESRGGTAPNVSPSERRKNEKTPASHRRKRFSSRSGP
jgi:hypothetical protein